MPGVLLDAVPYASPSDSSRRIDHFVRRVTGNSGGGSAGSVVVWRSGRFIGVAFGSLERRPLPRFPTIFASAPVCHPSFHECPNSGVRPRSFQSRHRLHVQPGANLPSLSHALLPEPRKSHGLAMRFWSFWIQTAGALPQRARPSCRDHPVACPRSRWRMPASYRRRLTAF
jgi:hypothetical protein